MTLNSWNYKIIYASELKNREEVKRWMLEQQLGRRNLSETEKYEIVQKFKSVFEKRAKQNQSLGGKGLTNLTKVDTRKEMAKATGVSVGTYRKIDAVMKSGNEDLKQRLRKSKYLLMQRIRNYRIQSIKRLLQSSRLRSWIKG